MSIPNLLSLVGRFWTLCLSVGPNRIANQFANQLRSTAWHRGITNHRQLEIYDYRNALDGPGDLTLLNHLASAENNDEDSVVQATKSIGRLAEIFDAMSRRA